ncbi:DUF2167 domain-containing protein [Chitinophaga horti]|uniref:DUF2167 domain-containing protein n=1 Tax=Chitinophaga horti TaxID=2920382 RepID=A0ABY6IUH7_9BACT|nr:DUF2167 domain-containing protein [Chitinophaga horti]UYQ91024.1 DUF2167 domain-containing protein [Chitinophaga horti]
MFRKSLFLALLISLSFGVKAAPPQDTTDVDLEKEQAAYDSINASYKFQTGKLDLSGGQIAINVPAGFKFLDADQSKRVLTDLWGNPASASDGVLGMIFPADAEVLTEKTYAFIITYEETGYVKDGDAAEIDYDEMMKEMKDSDAEVNKARAEMGYGTVNTIGWAQKPYYDKSKNVLHWAQEFKMGDEPVNTLNYDVRVLGRKGVLSLKAVSSMSELPMVKANIDKILSIASFNKNYAYGDFDSNIDKVAAVGIGGLVAGKLLAKVGVFGLILKFFGAFWKFILLGAGALFAFVRRLFTKKKEEATTYPEPEPETALVEETTPQASDTEEKQS